MLGTGTTTEGLDAPEGCVAVKWWIGAVAGSEDYDNPGRTIVTDMDIKD